MSRIKFVNLPIYSVVAFKSFIYLSGGGGGKTGIPNEILIYERGITPEPANRISTDTRLYENMTTSFKYELMVCSANENLLVYDVKENGKDLVKLYEIPVDESFKNPTINSICFHASESIVAVGGDDTFIRFYRIFKDKQPELLWQYGEHRDNIRKIDSKVGDLSVSSDSQMAVVVNLKKKEIIRKFYKDQLNPTGCSLQAAYFLSSDSPNDHRLLLCHYIPRKQSYVTKQLLNGQCLTLEVSKDQSCATAKQDKYLGIACGRGETFVIDTQEMRCSSRQKGHDAVITSGFMTRGLKFITGTSSCSYVVQEAQSSSYLWLVSILISVLLVFVVAYGFRPGPMGEASQL